MNAVPSPMPSGSIRDNTVALTYEELVAGKYYYMRWLNEENYNVESIIRCVRVEEDVLHVAIIATRARIGKLVRMAHRYPWSLAGGFAKTIRRADIESGQYTFYAPVAGVVRNAKAAASNRRRGAMVAWTMAMKRRTMRSVKPKSRSRSSGSGSGSGSRKKKSGSG